MSGRDTHAASWVCSRTGAGCTWTFTITGSHEYVCGDMAARIAFLEVLGHETREHWPSKLLTAFVRDDVRMLDFDAIWELEPTPEPAVVG